MMNQVVNSGPNMIYGTSNHMKSSTFAPNHPPATISDHNQLNQSSVTIHMYEDPRNLSGNSHYQLPSPVAIDVGPPPPASNGPTNGPYAATSITNNLTKVNCYNSNNNNNNENSPHGYHHQPNYNTLSSVKRSSQPRLRSAKSTGALYASTNVRRNGPGKGVSPSVPSTYLENEEVYQIERFYTAHKTFVYVSRCMANLYFTKTDLINEGRLSSPRSHEWQLERTGVPVIIFDKGETKARDKRKLQICLAERGTGFNLWNDIIDNLTDYKAVHPCFHTLYLSSDHRKVAGLSFDSVQAANEFLHQVEAITCDPVNIALSAPKRSNSKKEAKSKVKRHTVFKLPTKEAISSPCLFEHVTTVKIEDFDRLCSIASLVPRKVIASSANNSELRSLSSLNNTPCPPVASTSSSSMTSSENSSNFSI